MKLIKNKRLTVFSVFAVILVIAGFFSFKYLKERQQGSPRLVIVYAPCTVSKNFLSVYNPDVTCTPNLEQFGRDSSVFMKHRTDAGLSGIAYATMFTGNTSVKHGVFTHPVTLPDNAYTLLEAFRDNGYETFFWNRHPMASVDLNYGQGADQVFEKKMLTANDPGFKKLLSKLKADPSYKVFILTNFTVTHAPYSFSRLKRFRKFYPSESATIAGITPEKLNRFIAIHTENHHMLSYNFPGVVKKFGLTENEITDLERTLELLYKSNISHLDKLFGDIVNKVKEAGLYDDSLIVFTADHGEIMTKKDLPFRWSHGFNLASEVLDVPLLIKRPGKAGAGGKISDVTGSLDVLPTVAGSAGIDISSHDIEGIDYFNSRSKTMPDRTVFSFSGMLPEPYLKKINNEPFRALAQFYPEMDINLTWAGLRKNDYVIKYRKNEEGEFVLNVFDLSSDPKEISEIEGIQTPSFEKLSKKLFQYRFELIRAQRAWEKVRGDLRSGISYEKSLEKLKSLGYL